MFFKGSRESVLLTLSAKCTTDTGGAHNVPFKARYKLLSQADRKQLVDDATAGVKNDDDVVNAMLVDWQDVKDQNDEPVEFTPENVAAAMDFPPYREALVNGALQLIFGKEVLRRKNFQTPAANG